MSIKELLYNSISNYTSIDSLYEIGASHDKGHKQATIDRELRELTKDKKILEQRITKDGEKYWGKIKTGDNNTIIAYMKVYDAKVAIHQNEVKNAPQRQIEGNKAKPKVYCRYWINHNCQLKKKCNNCLLNK